MVKKKEKVDEEGQSLFNASQEGPKDEARAKALEAALTDLTKRFGDGTVVRLGDAVHMQVEVIPSGSLGVDISVGVGGIPRGRITEIYGPESSGKTTLCLHVIAEAQRRGGICAFVDMEHALDPAYAARIGVNTSTLYVAQPDTGENALEITESLVRSGALDVIVIDSVAALVPRAEIEGEMGDSHVGLQARLMSQALRKLSGAIKQSNVAVMFTNQIREKVGVMYGCFSNQAPVLLADGTSATIGEIVNQKKPVEVISWNEETGAFEPRRVINWFKNGVPVDEFTLGDNEIGALEQEYVTLRTRYPRGGGYKDGAAVMATPNHLIATAHGFQHAGDIDLGDQVLNLFDDTLLSSDLEQLVIGSTLGDGSIRYVSDQSAYFREEHAAAERDYVRWKYEAFGDLTSEWHENGRVGFSTKHLPVFARMRAWFYDGYPGSARTTRYKHVDGHVFHKLTPLSLAVWYQDDGDLSAKRRRNTITMHSTSPEERAAIVRAFQQRFGLTPIIAEYSATTRISFTGDEAERFEALIAPYVHPSMAYKLRSKDGVGDCLPALEFGHRIEAAALPCEVYEITRQIRRGKEAVRYNLQVEDNATYIVGDTIVHNSPETQPGGRALKFYASVRLDIRRVEGIKVGGDTVGNRTRVRVTKNKVAAPFRECEFDIMFYESGISKLGEVVDLGVELGMIEKRGAFFRYNDGLLGQGRENAKVFLMENKAVADEIEDAIRAHFGLPSPFLPPAG